MTDFKKSALELRVPEGVCNGDGYRLLFLDLEQKLKNSPQASLSIDDYLKEVNFGCLAVLLDEKKSARAAKKFLQTLAAHDGEKKSLSIFDTTYGIYDLIGEQWQEGWQEFFLDGSAKHLDESPAYSALERIRFLGAPLLDSTAAKGQKAKALLAMKSLATYVGALPETDTRSTLSASVDFYWNQKDPEGFKEALGVGLQEFLAADPARRSELIRLAVEAQIPEEATVNRIFSFLTRAESVEFSRECFRKDAVAAMALFEKTPLSPWYTGTDLWERASNESEFFPNLPQDHPYADRQKLIDEFLGEPVLSIKTNFWQAGIQGARPTLKKYNWVGDTEVFSIESENPGPTTLVFAPHFHEDNPRKMFHWIKDIPLQSGRILVIPEANRAMGQLKLNTNPMNGLFNEALNQDRIDYLIVRRVEYLMGLVDGMVGVHDAHAGPFYISDVVAKAKVEDQTDPAPIASPWIPKEVLEIRDIAEGKDNSSSSKVEPQPQWQVADYSRILLEQLYGEKYHFVPEKIGGNSFHSADSATGYMNFHLGKPAMTFEGRKGAEHGQLHAMALYTLLLGFGHQIDPSFEDVLRITEPEQDVELYEGLPVSGEPTKRPPPVEATEQPAVEPPVEIPAEPLLEP